MAIQYAHGLGFCALEVNADPDYRARMKSTPTILLFLGSLVSATIAPAAFADRSDQRGSDHDDHRPAASAAASGVAHASPSSAVAAAAASGAAAGTSAKVDDDGAADDEKPEQKEKRHGYIANTGNHLRDLVRANGKRVTDEERDAIRDHWRRAMRLWRIRYLAMVDGDKAIVARVDAILARLDKQTENKLKELNGKAPADGSAAAASAAPTASGRPPAAASGSAKKEGEK